jgi:peptidoglycan/LPS O-acetylase OafA/YrhL
MSATNSSPGFFSSLPERLSRITSGGKFIKEIDGLRFVAILPVVVYHLTERFERDSLIGARGLIKNNPTHAITNLGFLGDFQVTHDRVNHTSDLVNMGFLGVYIFFVISGFILAVPFAAHLLKEAKPVKLLDYYWRRVTRLEPTYIIWCTIFYALLVFVKHSTFGSYLLEYISTVTYTHTLIYNTWSPFNPVTWTLEVEIQFYILAPFLASAFFMIRDKMQRRTVNVLLIIALVFVQSLFHLVIAPFNWCILAYLHYFLIGFLLADIYLVDWSQGIKKSWVYDFVAVAALIVFVFSWSWAFQFLNRILVVASLFVFFFAAFKSNLVNKFLCNRWITAIGGMCYTIYLIHLPLAELFIRLTKRLHITNSYTINLLVQELMFLPVVFVLSSIAFLLFEKPFMDKYWPKKLVAFFKKPAVAE